MKIVMNAFLILVAKMATAVSRGSAIAILVGLDSSVIKEYRLSLTLSCTIPLRIQVLALLSEP